VQLENEPDAVLDCVAFIICDGNAVLAERRKMTRKLLPGALALPGGHVEPGESIEAALARELMEELRVVAHAPSFVCALLHHADEIRRIHYYAIESWTGEIENHEAETLHWIPLGAVGQLDVEVDRTAMRSFLPRRMELRREGEQGSG
jgi:mutator protein MutT